MVAQSVEQLKREYTDKFVKVDGSRPELARFRDVVGQVKTVNMSGRALVEFLDYHLNIGWFDIDLSFLTVVPKPTDEQRAAAKAAQAKPAAKAAEPKAGGGAKPAAGKMSVADMLASARGGGGSATPAAKPAAKDKAAATKPAGKMSVAEMLAAARATSGGAAAPPAAEAAAEAPAPVPAKAKPAAAPAKAAAGGIVKVDRDSMSVAEMIAYCREHDAA